MTTAKQIEVGDVIQWLVKGERGTALVIERKPATDAGRYPYSMVELGDGSRKAIPDAYVTVVVKPEKEHEKSPPATSSVPVPADRVMKPCKHCGQGVDITGRVGRAMGVIMSNHARRDCPARRTHQERPAKESGGEEKTLGPLEPAMRQCKYCGQSIDIAGLTGSQIASAVLSHRFRCPKAPPRKRYAAQRRQSEPASSIPPPPPADPAARSEASPENVDALLAGLRSLAGAGIRFRLEITNIGAVT